MKGTGPAIARVAACVAVAAWLAGCQKGTLGHPDAGGAGQLMGVGARGGPGIDGGGLGGIDGGGVGGSPGRGGAGGRGMINCPPPPPPVCGRLCGNGRVDNCIGALSPECYPYALREACDGADLGGASCADVGFASGNLVCDETCSAASGIGCSECVPMPLSVVSCDTIPPLVAPYIQGYAIAATDSEVGLAEIGYYDGYGMTLSLRRLTPSLATASSTTLLDTLRPGPQVDPYASIDNVAVAPIPSGWVIAACVSAQLLLFTVDAAGVNTTLAPLPVSDGGCGYFMALVARPGGGPLLLWSVGYGVSGALIAADGHSAGKPFEVVGPPTGNTGSFDGAWVGDAFNVAVSAFVPPGYDRVLRVARIDVDGTLTSRDLLMGEFDDMPRIARGAADLRVTYVARNELGRTDIKWRRFGPGGASLADALLAGDIYNYTRSPAVGFGDDTVVLLGDERDQSSSFAITRMGRDGDIVTPRYDILRAPLFRIGNADMVRRGPDLIVSWLSYGGFPSRVGLARIVP